MTKDRKQLIEEIDKLQTFINLCENAKRFGLGLDEVTHDKYTDAIARQRELGEQLEAMVGGDRGIYTSAQLLRKVSWSIWKTDWIRTLAKTARFSLRAKSS
jgi:hypothetical protein